MDPSIIRQRLLRDQIVNNPTTQDARTPLTELVQAAGIRDLASRVRANEERTSDASHTPSSDICLRILIFPQRVSH